MWPIGWSPFESVLVSAGQSCAMVSAGQNARCWPHDCHRDGEMKWVRPHSSWTHVHPASEPSEGRREIGPAGGRGGVVRRSGPRKSGGLILSRVPTWMSRQPWIHVSKLRIETSYGSALMICPKLKTCCVLKSWLSQDKAFFSLQSYNWLWCLKITFLFCWFLQSDKYPIQDTGLPKGTYSYYNYLNLWLF